MACGSGLRGLAVFSGGGGVRLRPRPEAARLGGLELREPAPSARAAAVPPAGILTFWPMASCALFGRPLASAMAKGETPYLRPSEKSVSPLPTVWVSPVPSSRRPTGPA